MHFFVVILATENINVVKYSRSIQMHKSHKCRSSIFSMITNYTYLYYTNELSSLKLFGIEKRAETCRNKHSCVIVVTDDFFTNSYLFTKILPQNSKQSLTNRHFAQVPPSHNPPHKTRGGFAELNKKLQPTGHLVMASTLLDFFGDTAISLIVLFLLESIVMAK